MSLSSFANSLYVDTMGPISCALTPFKKATKEQKILKSLFVSNMLLSIVAVDYNLSPAFEKTGQQEVKLMYITIAVAFLEVHLKTTLRRLLNRTENTKLKTYYAALKQNLAHLGSGGGQGGGRKRGGGRRTQKGGWVWAAVWGVAHWVGPTVLMLAITNHETITGWYTSWDERSLAQRAAAQVDRAQNLIERGQNATARELQADRDAEAALAAAKLKDAAKQAALARNHTAQVAAAANNATVTAAQLAHAGALAVANATTAAAAATANAVIAAAAATADGAITSAATTAGAAASTRFAELGAQHAAASRSDLNSAEEMLRTAAATLKAEVETCRGTAMEYAQLEVAAEEEEDTTVARKRLALVKRCVKGVQDRNKAVMVDAKALVAEKGKMYREALDHQQGSSQLRLDTAPDGSVVITTGTTPNLHHQGPHAAIAPPPGGGGGGNPGGGHKRKYRKRRRKTKRRRRKKRKTRRKRHRRTRRRR